MCGSFLVQWCECNFLHFHTSVSGCYSEESFSTVAFLCGEEGQRSCPVIQIKLRAALTLWLGAVQHKF